MKRFSAQDTLTLSETELCLSCLEHRKPGKTYVRDYLIFLLLADAGLRVGEVSALEWSDLTLNMVPLESVNIRSAISKTNKGRAIPMSKRLRHAVQGYLNDSRPESADPDAFVFHRPNNKAVPLSDKSFQNLIKKITLLAVGRPLSPHNLRHTFATNLCRVTNTRVVQELMGHANLQSTQVYTHPNKADLQKAIDSQTQKE